MKPENIVVALEKFFFEIIGQLLPGFLLLAGLHLLFSYQLGINFALTVEAEYWVIVGGAYITGSALTTLGSYYFIPFYLRIAKSIALLPWVFNSDVKKALQTNKEIDNKITESEAYKIISAKFNGTPSISTIRNIAMSSIDKVDKESTIRFRFLSLLSQGVASGLFILTLTHSAILFTKNGFSCYAVLSVGALLFVAFFVIMLFILREREFYDRARRLPIDCYLAILKSDSTNTTESKNKKTVYLSGGHHSGWQTRVKSCVEKFNYLDPSQTGITDPTLYTEWDLNALRNSDIIFAYFEKSNPSGYGLALEIGYAASSGKFVILVDEKSPNTPDIACYLKIIHKTANVVFSDFDEAVNYLKNLEE